MRIALILCAAALATLTACGGAHKATIYTSNGAATVTTDNSGKTTLVQSKEGQVTVGQGAVDTAKLGAPIYPGATQSSDQAAVNISSANGSGAMAAFVTGDSFDKVYGWYKQQLPAGAEKMKLAQGGSSVAEFVMGERARGQTMVMLSQKAGQTQILISRSTDKRSL